MVNLDFNFFVQDSQFCIKSGMTTPDFAFKIVSARLKLKRVTALESLQQSFEARLLREPAIFPHVHTRVKSWIIPEHLQSFMVPDLFSGSFLPHVCIFGFVNQAQSQGQWATSPFQFNPHNIKDLFIQVWLLGQKGPAAQIWLYWGKRNPLPKFDFRSFVSRDFSFFLSFFFLPKEALR